MPPGIFRRIGGETSTCIDVAALFRAAAKSESGGGVWFEDLPLYARPHRRRVTVPYPSRLSPRAINTSSYSEQSSLPYARNYSPCASCSPFR